MICIQCPNGCLLTAEVEGEQVADVKGNQCGAGAVFAKQEAIRPMRDFTALMRCGEQVIPVKAIAPVPKEKVRDLAEYLRGYSLTPPVFRTETVVKDALGLGIRIVAMADSKQAENRRKAECRRKKH